MSQRQIFEHYIWSLLISLRSNLFRYGWLLWQCVIVDDATCEEKTLDIENLDEMFPRYNCFFVLLVVSKSRINNGMYMSVFHLQRIN